jgi:hypothetical protein
MVDTVDYEVVGDLGNIELRRYGPLVVARVDGYGDSGFGHLFRYIQGNNRQRSKVAMTAPVISERGRMASTSESERIAMTAPVISRGDSMAFVMPRGYTLESTPEPLDPRVSLEETPARTVAVLRFSGRWSERNFGSRARQLMEGLEGAGIRTVGEVFSMVYNPPFTPWFMRRNEVAVEVEAERAQES